MKSISDGCCPRSHTNFRTFTISDVISLFRYVDCIVKVLVMVFCYAYSKFELIKCCKIEYKHG